jgi:serine/threonine-protein kinase
VTVILERLGAALAGRYTIERELGAGGMATVYVAHDVRHDRRVALKVLRPELAAVIGAERFLREIKTTANLQHPHILPLFDSGEADTFLFYVMPLVEGESLRDRLDRERQLGVDESVRLAGEVAAALDYAHRHGVIHRDVKPANILLHDGSALVTDFGIALAVRNAGADRITETGLSLGTPHYMSPEQATGDRDIGARSDIYSLAAVLYEMLAGEPPHSGGTIQAVIAKVLTEPAKPLGLLRQSVPVHVALAVEQALSKVPADRFTSAAEFGEALRNPAATAARSRATAAAALVESRPRPGWPLAAGATGVLAAGILLGWFIRPRETPVPPAVVQFTISADSGLLIESAPAISPDGSTIVYRVDGPGAGKLYVRRLGELEARPLPGTEDGRGPFFSPDGQWIGFENGVQVKKTRLDGGTPVVLASIRGFFLGGSWGKDNTIVFALWPNLGLFRINADAGEPQQISLADSTIVPGFPSFLPDGKTLLLTALSNSSTNANLATLDLATGSTRVFGAGISPQFVPPQSVVFASTGGDLLVQPFDPVRLDTAGPARRVADNVLITNGVVARFSVSQSGSAAYIAGNSLGSNLGLTDRSGRTRVLFSAPNTWAPRFSPEGGRIAYGAAAPGRDEDDVWIYDVKAATSQRLTFEGSDTNDPVWSSDGRQILISSTRESQIKDLYVQSASQTTGARLILSRPSSQWPSDWSRDGKTIVFTDVSTGPSGWDIWTVSSDGRDAKPFMATPFRETGGRLSPNGRWMAYTSNETGRDEVYVQAFPAGDQRILVSTDGGRDPIWGRTERELYYWRIPELIAATLATSPALAVTRRESLFRRAYTQGAHANYDVSPDGQYFAIVGGGSTSAGLVVALNLVAGARDRQ